MSGSSSKSTARWDQTCDVAVVGSGGGGLAAALTAASAGAEVIVVEKAPGLGGSTIFSGALTWVPNNHLMSRAGIPDSVSGALAYMRESLGNDDDLERRRAFLEAGPEMVRFLESASPLRFKIAPAPDSFAELPHGLERGRNIEPLPLNPAILGRWQKLLLDSPFRIGVPVTLGEAFGFTMAATGPLSGLVARLRLGPRYLWRRLTGRVSLGPALIIGLLQGCRRAGVRVKTDTPARELITGHGRVIGLKADSPDGPLSIRARKAVILATGGFEWNREMVQRHLPGPIEYPVTSPYCTGDGHRMADEVGARLENMEHLMGWSAGYHSGRAEFHGARLGFLINTLLSNPHAVLINRAGRRFVNEASHNVAQAYFQVDPETGQRPNNPAWSIFDSQWRDRYAEAEMGLAPGRPDPEWLIRADSLAELARLTGIDPAGLETTVERFNSFTDLGRDEDFHRGEHAYDWHFVARTRGNPNLGRIDRPPYYAVRIYSSTVGTKGGPMTDARWQVINDSGTAIPGLFAVGTLAATIIGPITISSSSAIGLILTQGYIAGRRAAADSPG